MFIIGSGVLCDRKLGKRQVESSCSVLVTVYDYISNINIAFNTSTTVELYSCK